MTDIKQLR